MSFSFHKYSKSDFGGLTLDKLEEIRAEVLAFKQLIEENKSLSQNLYAAYYRLRSDVLEHKRSEKSLAVFEEHEKKIKQLLTQLSSIIASLDRSSGDLGAVKTELKPFLYFWYTDGNGRPHTVEMDLAKSRDYFVIENSRKSCPGIRLRSDVKYAVLLEVQEDVMNRKYTKLRFLPAAERAPEFVIADRSQHDATFRVVGRVAPSNHASPLEMGRIFFLYILTKSSVAKEKRIYKYVCAFRVLTSPNN